MRSIKLQKIVYRKISKWNNGNVHDLQKYANSFLSFYVIFSIFFQEDFNKNITLRNRVMLSND